MRIICLPAVLAAQLLSVYNEETKPREEEKWVNLCLEEVRDGARQKSVLRGFCNAARRLPEQPGMEDKRHPSEAFRQGSQSTVHPGMSPGASGKGGDAAFSFRKMSGAADQLRCRPSSSGREPGAPRGFGSHLQRVWP